MAKRGRPKVSKSQYKGKVVQVRVTTSEYRRLQKAADAEGILLSEWVRREILSALDE